MATRTRVRDILPLGGKWGWPDYLIAIMISFSVLTLVSSVIVGLAFPHLGQS